MNDLVWMLRYVCFVFIKDYLYNSRVVYILFIISTRLMNFAKKLHHIVSGFANSVHMPAAWLPLAMRRAVICSECPNNRRRWWWFGRRVCSKCGCDIIAKTWSPWTECPIGKWGRANPNDIFS